MRLDDFDPNINVEDQRGQVGSGGGGGGGFNMGGGSVGGGGGGALLGLLPVVFNRFGCAGVVVLFLAMAVFGGGMSMFSGGGSRIASQPQTMPQAGGTGAAASCSVDAASRVACNAFSSADHTWEAMFQRAGQRFAAPKLVFYSNNGQSGCGAAQSAMGPFYCPPDQGIYLDTSFFGELANRFGAAGDFAQDYVIAHEFGHHIQNLLGTSDRVRQQQQQGDQVQGNALSVRLELQADCFAGVWAAQNRDRMDPGDIQEGMTAAHAIGDDTLQEESQGRVVPDSFTHGTAEQRQRWLQRGIDSGDPAQCDTFSGDI